MNITITVVVMLVAYTIHALVEAFLPQIPVRFSPVLNVLIALGSGFICYFLKLEPSLLIAIVTCFMATLSAGGMGNLIKGPPRNNQR